MKMTRGTATRGTAVAELFIPMPVARTAETIKPLAPLVS